MNSICREGKELENWLKENFILFLELLGKLLRLIVLIDKIDILFSMMVVGLLNERMNTLSHKEASVHLCDDNIVLSIFIPSICTAKLHFNSKIL